MRSSNSIETQTDPELNYEEETLTGLKPPSMYQVILFNDDFTPMDFVIEVLQLFFFKSYKKAEQIMWRVHQEGQAVCGVYTYCIAETKVQQVLTYAKQHDYPLYCEMKPIDG